MRNIELTKSVYQAWVDSCLAEEGSLEAVYDRFCSFLRTSLERWPRRFSKWTAKEQKVLEWVKHRVEDYIFLGRGEYNVLQLELDLEEAFGLNVPVIWGTLADVYFDYWCKLCETWNEEEV